MDDLVKNQLELQILTDSGWSNFDGVLSKGAKQTARVQLSTDYIDATLDHKVFTETFKKIEVKELRPRMKVRTSNGIQNVVSVHLRNKINVYDILNVEKNNRFYANNVLCSNCEFIIYDETLINPMTLLELEGVDPIQKQGQVRWYSKPSKGNVYLVALDPSLGTGGDYAAIQVLELPSMRQVAEWQHNKTPIQQQVKILGEITKYLADTTGVDSDVYYSVENNTIGEATLVTIEEFGEENIRGTFLSEPSKPGTGRRYRKGFTTTKTSKLAACAKLKSLIENKKMQISSKPLISELKTFVSAGTSYEAKLGENDDLVMALMLATRMAVFLRDFDPNLDDKLRDKNDEILLPMPFIMI